MVNDGDVQGARAVERHVHQPGSPHGTSVIGESYGARGDKRAGMRERLALATDSHCGDGKQAREAEPASLRRHRRSRFGAIVDRLSVRHRANGGETPSHRRPQAGLESFRKLAACL